MRRRPSSKAITLLLFLLHSATCRAFCPGRGSENQRCDRISSSLTSLLAKSVSIVDSWKAQDSYTIATVLLEKLLERRATDVNDSFNSRRLVPSAKEMDNQFGKDCEALVKRLADMPNHSYDPTKSLLGPLYCTLYAFNPMDPNQEPPLWEKISLQPSNIKGQQFFVNRDFTLSAVNYAEIFGSAFAIQAQARISPVSKESEKKASSGLLPSLFPPSSSSFQSSKARLRTCPDVYDFETYAAEFKIGSFVLPIPIVGTAKFVVLYADPRLRILQSPTGSDSVVGPWEQSGLVVVQVRSDLVTSNNLPLDLR